ncbi:MAG: hypothetical protein ACJ788_14125 [Ktedonobacteraceae bacterium]
MSYQQPPNGPGNWQQPQYPGQQYPQQPYPYQPPQSPPPKKSRRRLWLILSIVGGLLVVSCVTCGVVAAFNPAPKVAATPTQAVAQASTSAPTVVPTQAPTPTSTLKPTPTLAPTSTPTPQSIHYPPTTEADLRALAAEGDASAIHEFHSESVGLTGACPQPKREVTVSPSVTGQQLAEDLLAYFYGQQLDSPCGSVVFAYHNQSESGNGYTAGRILFDVTDSSGQANLDPNATNLKYTLTLDTGDDLTGQEHVVTY